MADTEFDLAVIGAGAVGVSCALWSQMQGLNVLLIDRNPPGSGTSYGNAGIIADYACVPVNSPSVIKNLPSLLFSAESPLRVDWVYALKNLPWMLSFLKNCSAEKVEEISDSLGGLLSHIGSGINPLIAEAGAEDLIVENGAIYAFSTEAGFQAAQAGIEARRRNGVSLEVIDADRLREMEPSIRMPVHKGLLFKEARHVLNPQGLVERLHGCFMARGGAWMEQGVEAVSESADAVDIRLADGSTGRAAKVVVSSGAHSKSIKGAGADSLPLDTERGHHVIYNDHGGLLSRPVGWADAGFYATPMAMGLRCAGTVEIAGLNPQKSKERVAYITRKSHEMFGDLGTPDDDWIGFRPTMPDSLPVIGPSPQSDRILYAFGHQHIGLTLSGITGRIIADLAQDRRPNFDISAFDARRFGGKG